MSNVNLKRFQKFTASTNQWNPMLKRAGAALELAAEAGELVNVLKKMERQGKATPTGDDRQRIVDEAGDVLWALSEICNINGIELTECFAAVEHKLTGRIKEGSILDESLRQFEKFMRGGTEK